MRVLAIDTSTARGSVALAEGGVLRGELRLLAPDGHSRHVLPAVEFLLRSLGIGPRELDGIAVAVGPGSFTGVRVGISTAQGLALAAARPCLGVSGLDLLAERMRGAARWLVPCVDAYRGEVFAALYDAEARSLAPARARPPEALLAELPDGELAFLGDGAERHRDLILERRPQARFPDRTSFLAGTLALLATGRFEAGEGGAPETLRPLYLREAEIRKA